MAEPRPSVVAYPSNPDELPDPETLIGAPALEAIQQGLGAYLESIGFVAEHPLLYVRETSDPYVYVRFHLSPDRRGFDEDTLIYSPGVTAQMHALFEAFGVYEHEPNAVVHQSETTMFGRPIHASIDTLGTYRDEENIFHYAPGGQRGRDRTAAKERRWARHKEKSWRRRWLRLQISLGRVEKKSFGKPFAGVPSGFWTGDEFNALPLNWNWAAEQPLRTGLNWHVDDNIDSVARASRNTWRKIVEPRLSHTSGAPNSYNGYVTGLAGGESGLGVEWHYRDRLYWSYKAVFDTYTFGDEIPIYSVGIEDHCDSLWDEFEDLRKRIQFVVSEIFESKPTRDTVNEHDKANLVIQTMLNISLNEAIFLYRRQTAICGHRRFGLDNYADMQGFLSINKYKNRFGALAEAIVYEEIFGKWPEWGYDKFMKTG